MNKILVLAAVAALTVTANSAYAQSAAKGLTTNPAGIAAVEFLDWFSEPEQQLKWLEVSGSLPVPGLDPNR